MLWVKPLHYPAESLCRSVSCLYRVSGFVSANGTKPKWQLWHRGGATRKKKNRKRWSGQDCCNPPRSPIGCPTYDFTENPPTSAYAGTSGFYAINIQLCILNWTTLSIVMRLWINNWTHAVVGQFANNENCHNFLPHDTPYLYDFFFVQHKIDVKNSIFSIQCSSMTTKTFWLPIS